MYKLDVNLIEQINIYKEKCLAVSNYLTDNPETGGMEVNSSAYIMNFLKEEGYIVTTPYPEVPYSFLAVPKNRANHTGQRAVFMCEYDALEGIGHACGHSLSAGVTLLGALAINAAYPDLPIRIDIMGTPGEESPAYKVVLADIGAFNGYEFAAMAHMFGGKNLCAFNTLSVSDIRFTFHGKSSHASTAPEKGINALNAARIFMDAMDMWRQHIPTDCQIHGIVTEGGIFPSIVPEKVIVDYWFRAEFSKHLKDLEEKARQAAIGATLCTGTTVTAESLYYPNDSLFSTEIAKTVIGDTFQAMGDQYEDGEKAGGSSDVGNVNLIIPAIEPLINITGSEIIALHDPRLATLLKTDLAIDGVYRGALLLSTFALRMANEPDLLAKFKSEHKQMIHERVGI